MIERGFIFSSALLLLGFSGILSLSAVTVTNFPVADAEIRENSPTNNAGAGGTVVSGKLGSRASGERRRAVLRFSLTNIPPNAIITTAGLHVGVISLPADDDTGPSTNSTFELHRTLKNWSETEVSWDSASSLQLWNSPGASSAGSSSTNDILSNVSSSVFVSGISNYTFQSTALMVADMQTWVNNPSSNFGWLLKSEDETNFKTARHFGARESIIETQRPQLVIDYDVSSVATPPLLTQIETIGNSFQFHFQAEPGYAYTVEKRGNIDSGTWSGFTNIPPQAGFTNVLVSDPLSPSQQFYRVKSP